MTGTPKQKRDDSDPAERKPRNQQDPGGEAADPSPAEKKDDRPDQRDVEPGSDAASDDDALGVGEPDTGPT